MKKLKIIYLGHLKNNPHRDSDEDIKYGFEKLGHEVIPIDDREPDCYEQVLKVKDPDLFLFHKGGIIDQGLVQSMGLARLIDLLSQLKCKKVFWYQDKVHGSREHWMEAIIPNVDMGFMVDETWIRRHNYFHLYPLKQGAPEYNTKKGKFKKKFNKICLPLIPYSARMSLVSGLYKKLEDELLLLFGDKSIEKAKGSNTAIKLKEIGIKHHIAVWGREFADMVASSKMIIAPKFPQDDFYWSARIYMSLVYGGLLLHPRFYGLKDEGFIDGKHYVGYSTGTELVELIKYFLKNPKEGEKIAEQGRDFVLKRHKYSDRAKQMLTTIYGE